jgi:hypothetical protein
VSLPLVLVTFGVCERMLSTGRYRALTAVLAALKVLCYPLAGLILLLGGAVLWPAIASATTALVAPLRRLPVVESTFGTLQWIQIAAG